VTGKTAPELIAERANADATNMGLTSWKGAKVMKPDVTIAKNYLRESEIVELNRIVTMFLDFAEDQASRRTQIFLKDWRARLDDFLSFNQREVLKNTGRISRERANTRAESEYEVFAARRRAEIEHQAEEETLRRLEQQAKQNPKRDKQN